MADPTRLKRAVIINWLAGCCAVLILLLGGARVDAAVTMTVATTDGAAGGSLALTWSLSRTATDVVVAGAQIDIIFDTAQMQLGSCTKNPLLTQQDFSVDQPTFPPVPAGDQRLRLAVFDDISHPTGSFDAGVLATCTFQVQSSAVPGQPVSLSAQRAQVSDLDDNPIFVVCIGGQNDGMACSSNSDCLGGTCGVAVTVSPGQILPPPTPTPTPIPCFFDQDCPLGQVCDQDTKVCKPAPTPTPTIPCPDGNCPDGLTCVNGVCVDLSTPTPTATPLPTCVTDADCVAVEGPGFHCRAGVCVPIRECDDSDPAIDRSMCRGSREACTNGECECGGDCNLDGYVLGNETTQMICVLTGNCPLTDCEAGDINGDGQITGNEVCTAKTNLSLGCPGEGQPLVVVRSGESRSLDIGSASGFPGDAVPISVTLNGGGDVATAQLDMLLDTTVLEIPNPDTDCQADTSLAASGAALYTSLPQAPSAPAGQVRLRLFVGNIDLCGEGLTYPAGAFGPGTVLTCTFHIRADAPVGVSTLQPDPAASDPAQPNRLNIGDPHGAIFAATSMAGNVTVLAPPTGTPTGPTPTPTPTGPTPTPTNTGGTPTPTNTGGTPTPTNTGGTPAPTNTGGTPTPTKTGGTPTPTNTGGTPTPTNTGGTPTPTKTGGTPTPTPTGPSPTPTPTGPTRTPTPTGPTATATASATPTTGNSGGGGGGGGGCTIGTRAVRSNQLLWIGVPIGLIVMRRRARR